MAIYIGADHRGVDLKQQLVTFLKELGEDVIDVGNNDSDAEDDYPDVARCVAEPVSKDPDKTKGIVLCGSGVGVNIAVNKHHHVRSGVCMNTEQAESARMHDDINILALAADFVDQETAQQIVKVFLNTEFSGKERHKRRIEKLGDIEQDVCK